MTPAVQSCLRREARTYLDRKAFAETRTVINEGGMNQLGMSATKVTGTITVHTEYVDRLRRARLLS